MPLTKTGLYPEALEMQSSADDNDADLAHSRISRWSFRSSRRSCAKPGTHRRRAPPGLGRPSFSEHFSPSGVMQRRPLLTSEAIMNGLIYLIGLIVVVLFILSFLGLR
jgi:hypothetical protein